MTRLGLSLSTLFLSTPSARRATRLTLPWFRGYNISIHALREEGDHRPPQGDQDDGISIHALREEGDHHSPAEDSAQGYFYPRPPRGGRPEERGEFAVLVAISIHALREEGDQDVNDDGGLLQISIHALREEGDFSPFSGKMFLPISIHALREEGDPGMTPKLHWTFDFYPRPPRGGRPVPCVVADDLSEISIHALREEGDCEQIFTVDKLRLFLSTPSARRATLRSLSSSLMLSQFLSTPSARRATPLPTPVGVVFRISIHALREEGDFSRFWILCSSIQFLSTPSARRAT